jgi:hypothetical protein
MAKADPGSREGPNHDLQNPMVAAAEPGRIGKGCTWGMEKKESKSSRGKKEADPDLGGEAADQDFGKRVHRGRDPKEGGGVATEGGILIPEDAEATALAEVAKSSGQDARSKHRDTAAKSKPMEEAIGPGGTKGAGSAEKGDALG